MPFMPETLLPVLIFSVALLYAMVGHGGASGYLFIFTLFSIGSPELLSTHALLMNLVVATSAWSLFRTVSRGSLKLACLFLVTSIPSAFLGATLRLSAHSYQWLLSIALIAAAVRLWVSSVRPIGETKAPGLAVTLPTGAAVGVLSGMVGVGGGIFLSPLMILFRWADLKTTAAVSALFILINSSSGLAGRMLAGRLVIGAHLLPLLAAAAAGGLIGAHIGAKRIPAVWLARALSLVLLIAPLKWIL